MRRPALSSLTLLSAVLLAGLMPACSSLLGFEDLTEAPADGGALQDAAPDAAPDAGEDGADQDVALDAAEDQLAPDGGDASDAAAEDASDAGQDASDAGDAEPDAAETGADADCGDTTSSKDNCGYCGHSCLGGDCVQGMCQAFKFATIHDGAWGIAGDENRLYIAGRLNNEIVRVDKATGGVMSIDTDGAIVVPAFIALSSTSMVWSNRVSSTGSIASCPLTGCGATLPTVLESNVNRPNGIVVEGDTMYWAATGAGTIQSAKVADGSAVTELVPASLGYEPYRMALHKGYLYFSDVSTSGRVVRVPKTGGTPVVLGSSAYPAGIAVTDSTVYWADMSDSTGKIVSVPNADPPDGGLAQTDVAYGQDVAFSVAVDASNVYWVASARADSANGALRMCPLSGCPGTGPITLASGLAYPIDLVVDDVAIYVTIFGLDTATDGALLKIAKP